MPTTREPMLRMMTTVKGVYSALPTLNLMRRSTIGHDGAAQVDHALEEARRIGDRGRRLVAADFLHLENVDRVFLGPRV
jgi:hypothetical protein